MAEPTPEQRQAAQDYASDNLTTDTGPLVEALREVYGDGWALGALSGAEQSKTRFVAGLGVFSVPSDWAQFWSDWEPGNLNAAVKLSDGGFARLLTQASVSVQDITSTTVDRIGSILAEGALNGDSVDTIAQSINEFLDDRQRAFTIANTELNRAVTQASLDTYTDAGVEQWDLIISPDACPLCVAVEAANPHPVDDAGDAPPIHPNCRCAAAPAL